MTLDNTIYICTAEVGGGGGGGGAWEIVTSEIFIGPTCC